MWARLRSLAAVPAVRDAAVALLASRLLVWLAGIVSYESFDLAPDAALDHGGLTQSFGSVGNALAAPAVRWDSNWYIDIAGHGYANPAVEPAFFPLYPLTMRALGLLTGSVVVSGVLISFVAFFVALVLVHRLTELELGADAARRTVFLIAFFPTALFFTAVYTESLFLALEVGALYAARRGNWWAAGALGTLGAATRNTGVLLAPVLLVVWWTQREGRDTRDVVPIALVPLGLAAFLVYLEVHVDDALASVHATQDYFKREFDGPLSSWWQGARPAWDGLSGLVDGSNRNGSALNKVGLFTVASGALVAAVGAIRRLPPAYGLLTVLWVLAALSFPFPAGPLASSLRYLVVVFPLFMWLGVTLTNRWAFRALLAAFAVMLAYTAGEFATWDFAG